MLLKIGNHLAEVYKRLVGCTLIGPAVAMDFVQKMRRALQRGRSVTLPSGCRTYLILSFQVQLLAIYSVYAVDEEEAVHILLPYAMQNQFRYYTLQLE